MTAPRVTRIAIVLLLALCSSSCGTARDPRHGNPHTNESLNAVLWRQTSAEYRALAEQAYRWARIQLDTAMDAGKASQTAVPGQARHDSNLPPSIIVDVDDTILDSSPFQARLVKSGHPFQLDLWQAWVREAKSPAIPGALKFVRHADAQGVRIFYVTNRRHDVEGATRRNLENLGFPVDPDGENLLTRNEQADWGSDKASRRAFIARRHRVLLIVGDDLGDFLSGAKSEPEQRGRLASQYRSYWGVQWIVIPNPMYGSWERAFYGQQMLPRIEQLRRKYEGLSTLAE